MQSLPNILTKWMGFKWHSDILCLLRRQNKHRRLSCLILLAFWVFNYLHLYNCKEELCWKLPGVSGWIQLLRPSQLFSHHKRRNGGKYWYSCLLGNVCNAIRYRGNIITTLDPLNLTMKRLKTLCCVEQKFCPFFHVVNRQIFVWNKLNVPKLFGQLLHPPRSSSF